MKVGFVSRHAYGLFNPQAASVFGGTEVRASLFAKGLAARPGFEVYFVVRDEGQPRRQQFGDVTVFVEPLSFTERAYLKFTESAARRPSFPWIKVHRWQPGLLWQLPPLVLRAAQRRLIRRRPAPKRFFRRLDCDVLCCFGVKNETADMIATCRRYGKKSILLIASDYDLCAEYYAGSRYIGPWGDRGDLGHYALTRADRLVVQTREQQHLLRERFGREATLIKNPIDLAGVEISRKGSLASSGSEHGLDWPPELAGKQRYALWVGRADVLKRPELGFELARRCPEVPLVMIMNRGSHPSLFDQLVPLAPSNVQIIERVPFREIDNYFQHASAFVSTSALEGFPNTFLQAAKHGVPILSLQSDPDGFITRTGCGRVAGDDLDRLVQAFRALWNDPVQSAKLGQAGRAYVEQEHALAGRIDELETLLKQLEGT